MAVTEHEHLILILSPHLFSLMVRLSHFDVRDQVPTGASVQDMRHSDHQVIERRALRLLSSAQLMGDKHNRSLAACDSCSQEKLPDSLPPSPLPLQASG